VSTCACGAPKHRDSYSCQRCAYERGREVQRINGINPLRPKPCRCIGKVYTDGEDICLKCGRERR
jgi:hypothetical protein